MKRRYLYLLLFALPATLLALIAAGVAVAGAAGVLWLFVFGDDPWPRQSDLSLAVIAVLAAAPVLAASFMMAWRAGLAQESQPRVPRGHLGLAIGLTLALGALIVLQLAGPRRGPVSDGERCADWCRTSGFDASANGGAIRGKTCSRTFPSRVEGSTSRSSVA